MEQVKPRVRVFTRSRKNYGEQNHHARIMCEWRRDYSLVPHKSLVDTDLQINLFYKYREDGI